MALAAEVGELLGVFQWMSEETSDLHFLAGVVMDCGSTTQAQGPRSGGRSLKVSSGLPPFRFLSACS